MIEINNRNKKQRLCIVTLDPYNKGGILSMMSFVYFKSKESGLDPFLVYNLVLSLRGSKNNIGFLNFLKGKQAKIYQEEFEGMIGLAIDRLLPEFEFFNYLLNLKKWKEVVEKGDIFFAVAGSNHCALPLVLSKKNFSLWVATTLYEDRIDRIKKEPFFRKIRDYLSLPVLLYFEKLIFKKAKRILVLSGYTKTKIIEKYKIDETKIDIAHYPIDSNEFYPLEYPKRKNDYLLFTARFNDPRKNIPLLLLVFVKIIKSFPKLKLKLIGENPDKEILNLTKNLKIEDKIEFLKFLPRQKLLSYYQNALLFVIPSFQEGLCISGLEALSCGIPVVSTRCGGPEDFVKDDYNGYLVDNNNEKQMEEAILRFLNLSDQHRRKMAGNSRNYILKNHQIEKIWPKFLECFK